MTQCEENGAQRIETRVVFMFAALLWEIPFTIVSLIRLIVPF